MNKNARFKVLPKSEQTPEYAVQVLSNPYSNQCLVDISKKLWSPAILDLAVRMGKATLAVLPEAARTEALCLAACSSDPYQISNIPVSLHKHEFYVRLVSQNPYAYGSISFTERTEYEANNLAPYNQSYEAVDLALAALCPVTSGEKAIEDLREKITLQGDARKDFIAENYGRCDHIPRSILRQGLTLLLASKKPT